MNCRDAQKRRHIIAELHKKKEATLKKAQTIANVDPLANDKQRLLQADSTVVGNVSNTMGSPKEFTHEPNVPPPRSNPTNAGDHRFHNREHQTAAPPPPPPPAAKESRGSHQSRDENLSFQPQRPLKSSRERVHVPFESDAHFPSSHYEPQYPEMVSMQEQHPRVVVRTIRDDGGFPNYHQGAYDDPSNTFVSIPVQIETSSSQQRFVPPPYHSDPYYPHINS